MDLMQSEDQDAIQETVRSFLSDRLPLDRTRVLAAQFTTTEGAGEPAAIWRDAGSLGFFGLGLPQERGGAGFSVTEEMILLQEIGRVLAPGPWLGSVVAAGIAADEGERAAIVAGERPCALVAVASGDRFEVSGTEASGSLARVADAGFAQALLVRAGDGWYYVRRGDDWRVEAGRSLDPMRPLASLSFAGAECSEVASGAAAERLDDRVTALSCAEAIGGIESTVNMSVEYCKVRTQFGKPIGSFQAVKHRCADMAVRAEVARSATIYAVVSLRDAAADAAHHVAVAKLMCGDAYLKNGADNIQNHGGMGFTWECDAHLYMKRAHSFDLTFGARPAQLDTLVREMRAL